MSNTSILKLRDAVAFLLDKGFLPEAQALDKTIDEMIREQDEEEAKKQWGVCPECGDTDGYLNVGRTHWFVCHEHRIAWNVGEGIFSTWRDETVETNERNAAIIESYRQIDANVAEYDPYSGWPDNGVWFTSEDGPPF